MILLGRAILTLTSQATHACNVLPQYAPYASYLCVQLTTCPIAVENIEYFTNDLPVEERASALAAMPPLARAQVLAQLSPEYRVQSFGPMNDQDLTAALAALSPADYAATLAAMKPDARVRAQKLSKEAAFAKEKHDLEAAREAEAARPDGHGGLGKDPSRKSRSGRIGKPKPHGGTDISVDRVEYFSNEMPEDEFDEYDEGGSPTAPDEHGLRPSPSRKSPARGVEKEKAKHDAKKKARLKKEAQMFERIEVEVIEGKNLRNMEIFGTMSPYAVVWVNFEPHEKSTEVVNYGGTEPKFNCKVAWDAKGPIEKLRMKLIVWDKETFGFDDYIGGGDLGVHTMQKGETIKKWVPITQHTQPAGTVLCRITIH